MNIVQDADVVVEAFDNPKSKALLVNILLEHFVCSNLLGQQHQSLPK